MTRQVILIDGDGARLAAHSVELDGLQQAVGGYIEGWPYGPQSPTVYVNEEGLVRQLPVYAYLDGQPVSGPIIALVKSRDLTQRDFETFMRRVRLNS